MIVSDLSFYAKGIENIIWSYNNGSITINIKYTKQM